MDSPNSWSTNDEAHVSASNHSNPIGAPPAPFSMRIRTHGDAIDEHESPEDEHARSYLTEQVEVCDMRHAIAPHSYEECPIMSHSTDGSHSNPTTTAGASGVVC